MVDVGIAGIGFMGWIHYLAYQKVEGIRLAAFTSRSEKKRSGDWRGIKGNFGPEGGQIDVSDLAVYSDFQQMLADPNLDVIDICYPPGMHVEATLKALQAGKHVFCEKPMALSIEDCRRMYDAAQSADRLLLIGHVLPFFPEYAHALELVRSGKYGKPIGGNFKRIISDPTWIPDFYDPRAVGGPLLDLHVHDAHLIRLVFGMPAAVSSQGRMRGEVVEFCNTHFRFGDPSLVVGATSGVLNQQGRPFTHGFEIQLEQATLLYDFAVIEDQPELAVPLTVLEPDGKVTRPQLSGGDPLDAFHGELREVAAAVGSGKPSSILDGELARDAVLLCQKQTESVRTGTAVSI